MAVRRPLEDPGPVSESVLWSLQREYYQLAGIRAFSTYVLPEMITTNAYIAATYAKLVVTFLREWRSAAGAPPDEPIHIIEVGAGSGRFAHHFLQKLVPRLAATPILADTPVVHVMTDLPGGNVDQWRRHPLFRPHVAAGRLDFGTLDATTPDAVRLVESGRVIARGSTSAPLVLVANYVFDSLRFDAYLVENGEVSEYTVAVLPPEPVAGRQPTLEDLQLEWSHRPVGPTPRYDDPELERVLRVVTAGGASRSILVPTDAIRFVRHVRDFTRGPMLLLTADKGYCRPSARVYEDGPYMATHGSVSFMVDYSVMAAWARARGGLPLLPDNEAASLTCCAFLFDAETRRWPGVVERFDESIRLHGPDDFFSLEKTLLADDNLASLGELLARLRAAEWDPSVFARVFPGLMIRGITADAEARDAMLTAAREVEHLYFPIGEESDVPFALAMLRWRAGDNDGALRLLGWSEKLHGAGPDRAFARALCHVGRGDRLRALAAVQQALELDPAFLLAHELYGWLSGRGPVYDDPELQWGSSIAVRAVGGEYRCFHRVQPE